MRDMAAKGKPVYEVGTKEWVPFVDLPPGIGLQGDADVEVKECDEKEAKKHKAVDIRSKKQIAAQVEADAAYAQAEKDDELARGKEREEKAARVAAQARKDREKAEASVRAARLRQAKAKKEAEAAKAKKAKAQAECEKEVAEKEAAEDAEIAAMIAAEEKETKGT
jgi:hypothetical protein